MKSKCDFRKEIIIDILTYSFLYNDSVNYIVKQDQIKLERIRALMDYSYEVCSLFGEVRLSDDHKACALILYPQNKRTTLKAIFLDLKLIINAIGLSGITKALDREKRIKDRQTKEPMAYLWFIGVQPDHQHQGIGSQLLQEIIADANAKHLPIYLETSTLQNISWYKRFGFDVYDELELTYKLYFLRRGTKK